MGRYQMKSMKVQLVPLPEAAKRKGVSRQVMWQAVEAAKVNWLRDQGGDCLVYLDQRFEKFEGRPESSN